MEPSALALLLRARLCVLAALVEAAWSNINHLVSAYDVLASERPGVRVAALAA